MDTPLRLLDAAPIVPGANVSRPLHEANGCKIVLFAMDAGQAISAHTVRFPAVVQVLDGRLRVTIGETVHAVEAGCAILLPAGMPHGVAAEQPARWLLTMMRPA
ncbi:MAG: cupin domain-containing protein [Planctomycetes bacterium]|nr:cupin domain-containing protein [Planctomycetota bacterium]